MSDFYHQFKEKNPQIQYEVISRSKASPHFSATYINGFVKEVGLKNE